MDVRKHPRHLFQGSEKLVDLPPQPGLLHRLRHLGFGRTKASVRTYLDLLSVLVCHHRRRVFAIPLLAMAAMASQVQGQVHQHSDYSKRRRLYSPSHRYQLLLMVHCRVYLPILDKAEELFVVVQVQLYHKRCTGLWYVTDRTLLRDLGLTHQLPTGTVFCFIFIFFTLQYPKGGVTLKWWGNEVWMNSKCDT